MVSFSLVNADEMDIVDTAVDAGSFNTLAAAIEAADLVDVLKSDSHFTVFAPTDEAFEALPEGMLEMLLEPENKDLLVQVLTYHVVSGEFMAEDLVKLSEAETVQGEKISIEVDDGKVILNSSSTVVATDVLASNGVIHVIDTVIVPPSICEADCCGSCDGECKTDCDKDCCGSCGGTCTTEKPSCGGH